MEDKILSIRKNAVLNIIRTLLSIIFPLVTFPYVTRVLGPVGLGKTQFASNFISYFVMFAGLGIGTYGIREIAKKRDNKQELSKVAKEIFILNLIPTIISYFLLGITLFVVPKLNPYRNLLFVYSATILFSTIGIEWFYNGLEQYVYMTVRQLFFQILSFLSIFIFVRSNEDYLNYAILSVIANVGANVCNFIHSRKYVDWRVKGKLEISTHLKPVFILFGTRVAASLYVSLDTTLLGFITDDSQIGYYESANKISRVVVSLITSVTAVLLPRLSYYLKNNEKERFNELLRKSFYGMLMFALPIAAGLFLLSGEVTVLISGKSFIPAIPTMRVLSALILVIPLSGFMGNQLFIPMGKEKITLYAMLVGAFVNVSLSVWFIFLWGAFGAAFASLLAEFSIVVVYFVFAYKWKLFLFEYKELFQFFISVVLMATFIIVIQKFNFMNALVITLSVIFGAFIYGLQLFLFKNKTFMEFYKELKNRITCKRND